MGETGRKLAEPQIPNRNTAVTYLIRGSVPDDAPTELLDDHRALEPPDPIPNSAVKRRIADGSVGLPHVRVGHRQAPIPNPRYAIACRGFVFVRDFADQGDGRL